MKSVTMTKQNMGLLTLIFSKLSSGAGCSGPRQEQTPNKEDKTLEKVADTFFVLSSVGLDRDCRWRWQSGIVAGWLSRLGSVFFFPRISN